MNIKLLTVGPFEVNCAILWGKEKKALILDPGHNASDLITFLKSQNLSIAAYLLTHGHADHIQALAEIYERSPAPIYMHAADEKWAFGSTNQIPPYYAVPKKPAIEFLHPETSAEWNIHDLSFTCLETPGHTPGGVCYWFEKENVCFTGDTLFKGTCGRTDLPGGDARILKASLQKLIKLPQDTRIIAGHGNDTTIGQEIKTNFFLR